MEDAHRFSRLVEISDTILSKQSTFIIFTVFGDWHQWITSFISRYFGYFRLIWKCFVVDMFYGDLRRVAINRFCFSSLFWRMLAINIFSHFLRDVYLHVLLLICFTVIGEYSNGSNKQIFNISSFFEDVYRLIAINFSPCLLLIWSTVFWEW